MRAIEENKEAPLFRFCGVFSEASLSGQRLLLAARLEALQISPASSDKDRAGSRNRQISRVEKSLTKNT